ncbi:MAG: PhzF family phenazine biosynthesis protein [Bacillota bacterium]
MKEVDIYQVDAFTDVIFGGNPAGVVPDATGLTEDVMQKIAREMALSETAFIIDRRGKSAAVCACCSPDLRASRATVTADFDVRFFTPWNEVDLCGHATIGGFWLLAELGMIRLCDGETRVFQQTKAGLLPVDIAGGCEGTPARVMMTQNLPTVVMEPSHEEIEQLEGILGAPQGCVAGFVGPNGARAVPQVITTGLPDLIVPVNSREALLSMRPNMAALIDFCNARKIISVHCFSLETLDPAATVHCRDFSPAVGVPEESATGTASGATGGYLVLNRLVPVKEPVTKIVCEQGHILKRPSIIHVEVESHGGQVTNVRVGGSAVTAIKGKVLVP